MEQISSNLIKLQKGWTVTSLGKILLESKEKFSPNKATNKRYIGLEHIEKDIGSLNGYGNSNETLSTKNTFDNGDLLYGKLRPYLNKVAVPDFDGVCSTDILVFKKHENLFNNFIKYRLLSRDFVNYAQINVSGVQHPRINKKLIDNFTINLPPLPEQHCIVEKIEELFSELDNGIQSLKKAREQLKTYRQAVLKHAFEGKLTREWREQQIQAGNPPEPAEKLLVRIKKERETQYHRRVESWQKACEQAKTDGSKKPAKPKKPKDLPPLTKKELAELPELPEGWGWVRTEDLGCIETGTTPSKKSPENYGNNYPFYKPTDLNCGNNVVKAHDNLSMIGYMLARVVPKNSILVTCIGATIGKTGIIRKEGAFNQQINAITPFNNTVPDYIYYQAICPFFQKQIFQKASSTTLPILNKSKFEKLFFAIASYKEQQEIVSEIETRLSVCDQLEQTIEDSLKRAEALRQSILKKAFEGELTKEWREAHPELISGENSAESLLARIRTEKARLAGDGKQRRHRKVGKK